MNPHHESVFKSGKQRITEFQDQNPKVRWELDRLMLQDADLSGIVLNRQQGGNYHDLQFSTFERVDLSHCTLSGVDFSNSNFLNCSFRNAELVGCKFENGRIQECNFEGAEINSCYFRAAAIVTTNFKRCTLKCSNFHDVVAEKVDFSASDISQVDFERASLKAVDFSEITCTDLDLSKCDRLDGTKVSRWLIEDCGSISWKGTHIRQLVRIDDFGTLKTQFSGPTRLVALASALIFAAPYFWFVFWNLVLSRYKGVTEGRSLLIGLIQCIVSGNSANPNWSLSLSFFAFFALASFHSLRLALLRKTLRLDADYAVYKIYPDFSFEKHWWWSIAYQIVRWGTLLSLLVAILNTVYYLWQVPMFDSTKL